jgi:aspartyl/glutamyl-tRNA(Asn/Gln) amidotransferase C subunit
MAKEMKEKKERVEAIPEIGDINDQVLADVIDLARLDPLTPGMSVQKAHLRKILDHFKVLNQLHLEGMESTMQINPTPSSLRPDVVITTLSMEEALSNAHLRAGGLFMAPQILSGERREDG